MRRHRRRHPSQEVGGRRRTVATHEHGAAVAHVRVAGQDVALDLLRVLGGELGAPGYPFGRLVAGGVGERAQPRVEPRRGRRGRLDAREVRNQIDDRVVEHRARRRGMRRGFAVRLACVRKRVAQLEEPGQQLADVGVALVVQGSGDRGLALLFGQTRMLRQHRAQRCRMLQPFDLALRAQRAELGHRLYIGRALRGEVLQVREVVDRHIRGGGVIEVARDLVPADVVCEALIAERAVAAARVLGVAFTVAEDEVERRTRVADQELEVLFPRAIERHRDEQVAVVRQDRPLAVPDALQLLDRPGYPAQLALGQHAPQLEQRAQQRTQPGHVRDRVGDRHEALLDRSEHQQLGRVSQMSARHVASHDRLRSRQGSDTAGEGDREMKLSSPPRP